MKKIIFRFTDTFENSVMLTVEMPYSRHKAINGYYSRFWRTMRRAVANASGIHLILVSGSFRVILAPFLGRDQNQDRMLFMWPNGATIDLPADATRADLKIVLAQLDVLQMRFRTA